MAFWAALFLFVGATGKSAQIPLYVWLPDAMAGPTPVSALIHAATMVTAGVYMVARMHAVYLLAPGALAIVAAIGALTALFAAMIGFAQNDFKKVLAYSTVSQLGFMFVGVGTGNFEGGIFHLFTHAFFKAGLFLCAGSVMHAMSGSGDITIMGGLRKKLPWTHGVFVVCWLAICGVVFSGFFSKDSIIAGAIVDRGLRQGLGLGRQGRRDRAQRSPRCGTAFYMSRLYFLVFSGETRASDEIKHHIHESPGQHGRSAGGAGDRRGAGRLHRLPRRPVRSPGAGTCSIASCRRCWARRWRSRAHHGDQRHGRAMVLALGGIGLACVFYGGGYREPARRFAAAASPSFVKLVQRQVPHRRALRVPVIVRPVKRIGEAIYFFVDRILIDKILVGVPAAVGRLLRPARAQVPGSGDVQRYMAVFAVGVAVILYFATQPDARVLLNSGLKVTVSGLAVDVDARRSSKPSPSANSTTASTSTTAPSRS